MSPRNGKAGARHGTGSDSQTTNPQQIHADRNSPNCHRAPLAYSPRTGPDRRTATGTSTPNTDTATPGDNTYSGTQRTTRSSTTGRARRRGADAPQFWCAHTQLVMVTLVWWWVVPRGQIEEGALHHPYLRPVTGH
jgi:hypothetical protein